MDFSSSIPSWIKLSVVFLLGLFVGHVTGYIYFFGSVLPVLDGWSKLAEVLGGASIFFAAATFFHQRAQDRSKYVIELLKFFRDTIIPKLREQHSLVKSINPSINALEAWDIKSFDLVEYKQLEPKGHAIQLGLINAGNTKFNDSQLEVLNMLEEFSLEVLYTGSATHPALNSLKATFVNSIEQNVVGMLMLSNIPGNGAYPGIKELYKIWK